jgi:hypothetical protein
MLSTFETKTYPQLQFLLGVANFFLVILFLVLGFFNVLTIAHRAAISALCSDLKFLVTISVITSVFAVIWAWISTVYLRFHDRVHEPCIRKWRAWYDIDYIVRSLCASVDNNISPEFYERAFYNKRERDKVMQRTFYDFIGDYVTAQDGKRVYFYTKVSRYWVTSLIHFYAFISLLVYCVYCLINKAAPPLALIIGLIVIIVICEALMNTFLDKCRTVTSEQIISIKNTPENLAAIEKVVKEFGLWMPKKSK